MHYEIKTPQANFGELKQKAKHDDKSARQRAKQLRAMISPMVPRDPVFIGLRPSRIAIAERIEGLHEIAIATENDPRDHELYENSAIMAAMNGRSLVGIDRVAVYEQVANATKLSRKQNWGDWLMTAKQNDPTGRLDGIEPIPQIVLDPNTPPKFPDDMDDTMRALLELSAPYTQIRRMLETTQGPLRAKLARAHAGHDHIKIPYSSEPREDFDQQVALLVTLARLQGPYIIQPETPHTYMRYVAFIEPGQEGGPEKLWRLTERRGLRVRDDDRKIWQIIMTADISRSTKIDLVLGNMGKLFKPGSSVQKDLDVPRIFRHHRTMPADQKTLREVEQPIINLIDRIRSEFGQDMRLFCFDVGILPNGKITIFEFQIPFGLHSYPYTARRGIRSYFRFFNMISNVLGDKFFANLDTVVESHEEASLQS